jgi:hypothetical protein
MHDGELTDDDTTVSDISDTNSETNASVSRAADTVISKLPFPPDEVLKICAVVGSAATKQRYIHYIYIYIRLLIVYMSIGMYIFVHMHAYTYN